MTVIADRLRVALGPTLARNVRLAPHTRMRVGGPAEFFFEVHDERDLIRARRVCLAWGVPFTLLGGGSNVIVDDTGLAGLVVINRTAAIRWHVSQRCVTVAGGYDLDDLVVAVARRGWADLTFAAGIPGTVGGALAGGAGAFGHLVHEYLRQARVMRGDGTLATVPAGKLGIGYRESRFARRGDVLLQARFGAFEHSCSRVLAERIAAVKAMRAARHPPADTPCAGSFFKNLSPPAPDAQRVPAGRLLDRCGAKQMRQGGAAVFPGHANIIVNTGSASAADIHTLADRLADVVYRRCGVRLQREVRFLSNRCPSP
jgi:UDP-N-acetylmuramate dehydrogenase